MEQVSEFDMHPRCLIFRVCFNAFPYFSIFLFSRRISNEKAEARKEDEEAVIELDR